VKIFGIKQDNAATQALYATGADFCRIFESDMNGLYLLSLLLTANHELAEKCLVAGLDTSTSGTAVFKEWAQSWARRAIITNAIRMVRPLPADDSSSTDFNSALQEFKDLPSELAAVVGLEAFDRFVFVMSVLEGYSEPDCRLLLDCSSPDITHARIRVLNQLRGLTENTRQSGEHLSRVSGGARQLATFAGHDRALSCFSITTN
jgi:hypothetical protein